jgi:ligand-binding sensor domain-containing protein
VSFRRTCAPSAVRRALFALVLCVLLQAAAPPVVSGQARAQPVATSYSTEQGLSHRAVYALGLDRRGFLWAGTGDGLNRFDGSAFKPFQPNPTDSTALSDLFVGVLLAHGDALWVGTGRSGLQQLDLRSERFRRFRAVTTAPQGSDFDRIASLALAPGGLYVGTVGGLFRFDTRQGRFSRLFGPGDPRGTLPVPRVQALLSEPDGTLWMGAPDGLYRYDAAGDTLRQIRGVPERIVTLAQAPDGAVLVGTGRGLYRQTSPADAFTRLPGVAGVVHSLAGEQDGTLWIGTNGGLMRWLPGERRPQQVNEDDTRALLFDARGQLWAATQGRGLVRIQISGALFRVWESQRAFQGLSVDAAGTLWAASNVGVVRITPGRTLTPLPGNAG